MGQQAQLNLAVVKRQQHIARRGDEGLANAPPLFRPHRDVLKVRIGGGEPPGGGPCDGVGGVNAPRLGVDMALKRIGIGALQLG